MTLAPLAGVWRRQPLAPLALWGVRHQASGFDHGRPYVTVGASASYFV